MKIFKNMINIPEVEEELNESEVRDVIISDVLCKYSGAFRTDDIVDDLKKAIRNRFINKEIKINDGTICIITRVNPNTQEYFRSIPTTRYNCRIHYRKEKYSELLYVGFEVYNAKSGRNYYFSIEPIELNYNTIPEGTYSVPEHKYHINIVSL